MKKSPITTHVLNTATGKPAKGIPVTLLYRTFQAKSPSKFREGSISVEWEEIASEKTDSDGRLMHWLPKGFKLRLGIYEITFDLESYLKKGFYPEATVVFEVSNIKQHYHVPLLLSPFGYSTYRGS